MSKHFRMKMNRKKIRDDEMEMVKVCMIGMIAIILAIKLKSYQQEFSIYISLVACVLILFYAINHLKTIVAFIDYIGKNLILPGEYFKILLKMVGITYVCEFGVSICKDAGYHAIASQIEMVGKLSILVISTPIIMALLETVTQILQ